MILDKIFKPKQTVSKASGFVTRNYSQEPEFNPVRQTKGITYKAIDKIAQSASVYEPIVYRGKRALEVHELYKLLEKPNPEQSGADFVYLMVMLYEIYGEVFIYKAKGEQSKKVRELYLLSPGAIELDIREGELVGYWLNKNGGQREHLEVDEIIHDKRPNPFNKWRGISVLEKASLYVGIENTTSSFTYNYIRNSASPSGIVSLPDMEKETFKQFASQWREGYEGPDNAGKTAFVRGNAVDFKQIGSTLKDIEIKLTRDMAKEDVLMMFDVPKALLGMTDDKGYGRASVETLYYIFLKEKIQPTMNRLDAAFSKLLTTETEYVSHNDITPEDKEHKLKQQEAGYNKWLTVNEIRKMEGLDPIPGGDALESQEQAPKEKKIVRLKKVDKAEAVKKEQDEKLENHRVKLVATAEQYGQKVNKELDSFLNDQEQKILNKVSGSKKSFEEWLFSLKEESEEMAVLITPILLELMDVQAVDTTDFITGELVEIPAKIKKEVSVNILKVSGLFNEDTYKALNTTLAEGQAAGESLGKLKKRVETVYADAKGYRAERIARTESLRAANKASESVYQSNGYSSVQWFTNPGACEYCQSMNRRINTIGQSFNKVGDLITGVDGGQMAIDYQDIETPPLHVNCKCSINAYR